jgi:hypothetical protein
MRWNLVALGVIATLAAVGAVAQQSRPSLSAPRPAAPAPAADGTLGMALMGAFVQSDGTLLRGAGATGAAHVSAGTYVVDFVRDASGCYYSATSDGNGFTISAAPQAGNVNGVFLEFTRADGSGTLIDSEFYLTVFCAK